MHQFKIHTDDTLYVFNPGLSLLTDENGTPVVEKEAPQRRSRKKGLSMLRIQLGLRCNYDCEYCKQADQIKPGGTEAVSRGLVDRVHNTYPEIENIYFAGGEPLLYWDQLSYLIPILRELYPEASMGMTSNGSLLNENHRSFFDRYHVYYVISHDGPGQYLRSGDPFNSPERLALVRDWVENKETRSSIAVNGVLTPLNNRPTEIVAHIRKQVGEAGHVSFEGVADLNTATVGKRQLLFDRESGRTLSHDILRGYVEGRLTNTCLEQNVHEFVRSMRQQKTSDRISQKCGQLREDVIAIDLQGNTLICHSATSQWNQLGEIGKPGKAKPDQFAWARRETCAQCLVQQLCKGGCLLNPYGSEAQQTTCKNDFYYHMGIFSAAFFEVTRRFITKIEKIGGA